MLSSMDWTCLKLREFEKDMLTDLKKDRLRDPDSRYGVQPLQLLQIVLVDRSFFEDRYHETVLLLPAYVVYYIDDNDPSTISVVDSQCGANCCNGDGRACRCGANLSSSYLCEQMESTTNCKLEPLLKFKYQI